MVPEEWQQVDAVTVFEKYDRAIVEVHFKLPSGIIETFTVRVEPPTVAVVALTENEEVVLTRQFRPGPRKVIYELPGGHVEDEDEDIKSAAERELAEETGYVGNVSIVGSCFSDSYSASSKFCGVARNVTPGPGRHLDPEEFIQVVTVSLTEFRKLLREGNIADVDLGYMGLDWMGLLSQ
jgi:ADP-ribose pyrophosphatase